MCIGRWLFPYWERCVAGQNSHAPDQNQSVLEGGANETRWRSLSSTLRLLKRSDSGQVACCCRCPPPSPPPSFGAVVRRWVVVVPFPKSQFGGKDPIASRSGRTRVSRRVLSAIWPVLRARTPLRSRAQRVLTRTRASVAATAEAGAVENGRVWAC